jgi:hypothetical protein
LPLAKIELDDKVKIFYTSPQLEPKVHKKDEDEVEDECCLLRAPSVDKHAISLYHFFRNVKVLPSSKIDVQVCGLTTFVVQNDESVRVFLISLKAGGVGLNLTAADYVYIVDPWWNPAVEQQAIDRTHRIGQDKNIFAYRMICVDTIEDKIIQLQEKKRALAKDLIADDNTFVKSLSREDVEYLFS